jgi:hypothetical protein
MLVSSIVKLLLFFLLTIVEYGGSGLGLYIARLLVKLQGGQIGVASVLGRGSKFSFYITVRRSLGLPPKVNVLDTTSPMHPGERTLSSHCSDFDILIVEDNLGW